MSVVNLREKTISAKVVYYGPPLGGKTTSLKYIHRVMDPERRTKLISLNTEKDRTLFFDFLPINIGRIGEYRLKIQGFTVPGQVKYLLTRRYVLRGADAVVFVADSQAREREANLTALRDLRENLALNGLPYESIPLVLEYNKRDAADILAVDEMERALNENGVPRFLTVATVGTGVFEAFTSLVTTMVRRICTEYRIDRPDEVASGFEAALRKVNESARAAGVRPDDPGPAGDVVLDEPGEREREGDLGPEQLLERALDTNVRVAELLTEVHEARSELEARVAEVTALQRVSSAAAGTLDEDRVVAHVVEGAAAALHVGHASILLRDGEDGRLRERGVHGFLYDPLVDNGAEELLEILRAGEPVRVTPEGPPGLLEALRLREPTIRAAVAAPLQVRGEARGLLVAYYAGGGPGPGPAAVRFLGALAASASVALENARLHGTVERMNRDLEGKVAERTRELEAAVADLRQLDRLKEDFLSNMSHELMTPLAGIRSSAEILRTYAEMDPAERAGFLQGIEQEAVRLTQRLQDILDLSAFEAGRAAVVLQPLVAREVVQRALERAKPALEAKGMRAGFWPASALPKVSADPRWLGRVLDHLLENAAKFSPPGSDVDVTAERDGAFVRIAVRDRGPGLPPTAREGVFERFKQGGQVLTDKTPGIGAGLPLSRAILQRLGGSIGLDGGPGRGTIAWIRVPVA